MYLLLKYKIMKGKKNQNQVFNLRLSDELKSVLVEMSEKSQKKMGSYIKFLVMSDYENHKKDDSILFHN